MDLLIDTHLILWAAGSPGRLPHEAKILIQNEENTLRFSVASIWEIAIKANLGRSDFKVEPRILRRGLLENGWLELSITSEHVVAIDALPNIHKDPFDRLLVAQANEEGLLLVTSDAVLAEYSGPIRKI